MEQKPTSAVVRHSKTQLQPYRPEKEIDGLARIASEVEEELGVQTQKVVSTWMEDRDRDCNQC